MKTKLYLLLFALLPVLCFAQEFISVNLLTGNLETQLSNTDKAGVKGIKIKGKMRSEDFTYLQKNLINVEYLDLREVTSDSFIKGVYNFPRVKELLFPSWKFNINTSDVQYDAATHVGFPRSMYMQSYGKNVKKVTVYDGSAVNGYANNVYYGTVAIDTLVILCPYDEPFAGFPGCAYSNPSKFYGLKPNRIVYNNKVYRFEYPEWIVTGDTYSGNCFWDHVTPVEIKPAERKVAPDKAPAYVKAVDLGLPSGTLWANMNIGATTPEGRGNYYAWGEKKTKAVYSHTNHITRQKDADGFETRKNLGDDISGTQYDVAAGSWGGTWCMPSETQVKELMDNCEWEWIKKNGVQGFKITGRNGNWIFLPAAGFKRENRHSPGNCNYWTSTHGYYESDAVAVYAYQDMYGNNILKFTRDGCFDGMPIRAVKN